MEMRMIDESNARLVNDLVSDAFQYEAPHRFFHDFPVWGSSRVLRLGLFEGSELLSHVGIRFCVMNTAAISAAATNPRSAEKHKVAIIGAVATLESKRGMGLSSKLLTEALRIIDEAGCSWSFLWGSEHAFYGKFGFSLQGVQARAALKEWSVDPKDIVTKDIKSGMTESIFQSLLKRKNGISFLEEDREWVFKHKTVKWYSIENPFAFVAFERGMDLKHMIHEIGGDQRALEKILYALFNDDADAEIIGSEAELIQLGFDEGKLLLEHLCLARPKNPSQKWNSAFWISGLSAS